MAIEICFVRHGETEANAAGIWQGTSDSPLTDAGRDQVRRLAERFGSHSFDLVVTSHLGRALDTSRGLGDAEIDERWRELHLGSWEGLTQEEIADRDPDIAAALGSGTDIAFGGGERLSEMAERLLEAFDALVGRLADGSDRAAAESGLLPAVRRVEDAYPGISNSGQRDVAVVSQSHLTEA